MRVDDTNDNFHMRGIDAQIRVGKTRTRRCTPLVFRHPKKGVRTPHPGMTLEGALPGRNFNPWSPAQETLPHR